MGGVLYKKGSRSLLHIHRRCCGQRKSVWSFCGVNRRARRARPRSSYDCPRGGRTSHAALSSVFEIFSFRRLPYSPISRPLVLTPGKVRGSLAGFGFYDMALRSKAIKKSVTESRNRGYFGGWRARALRSMRSLRVSSSSTSSLS